MKRTAEKLNDYREWQPTAQVLLRPLRDLPSREKDDVCVHNWVSTVNEVVSSGYICLKCKAVKPQEKGDD